MKYDNREIKALIRMSNNIAFFFWLTVSVLGLSLLAIIFNA